ncbi:hypothetical protein PENTCL1PPCAC_21402, partial [Pristionchus entomophagus]
LPQLTVSEAFMRNAESSTGRKCYSLISFSPCHPNCQSTGVSISLAESDRFESTGNYSPHSELALSLSLSAVFTGINREAPVDVGRSLARKEQCRRNTEPSMRRFRKRTLRLMKLAAWKVLSSSMTTMQSSFPSKKTRASSGLSVS